jgi:hypothetical protein
MAGFGNRALSTEVNQGSSLMPSASIAKCLGVYLLLCTLSSGCAAEIPPSLETLRSTCVTQGDENSCAEFRSRTGEAPEPTPEEMQTGVTPVPESKVNWPYVAHVIGCGALEATMSTFTGGMQWDCHLREIR